MSYNPMTQSLGHQHHPDIDYMIKPACCFVGCKYHQCVVVTHYSVHAYFNICIKKFNPSGVGFKYLTSLWIIDCDAITTYHGSSFHYHQISYISCTKSLNLNVSHLILQSSLCNIFMITSSNGTIFRVTGHLCGEFTGPRWIPHTKASNMELWYLLWSAPE